ncbi:MAG: UbiD family decarboxylase [Chloroflexi bacterium]|nr:UbiD family decarboxylase [Chloroflexota bacterium]
MAYYKDLREHLKALEANNKLVRVKKEINKDTELMPLVRWQFRGLPEEERKAFLFENVVDVKGRKYNMPVLVASCAASKQVYAIGMGCEPDGIVDKWAEAQLHSVKPKIVSGGPVHEEVHLGDNLLKHGGLDEFPVPISTPGFDNAPYFSSPCWVTKDPETGIRNIGVFRAMIKSQTRTGIEASHYQHIFAHWQKCKERGIPLQAAIVLGSSPAIAYAAVTKFAYGVDEYDMAGGIANEPMELVKCKTVDIEVPATAEIVIEGELPTDSMEREAPFGEYTGYIGAERMEPYFNVTCITHRRNPIYHAFISQFPPSESSKIRGIGNEASLFKFLRYDCGLPVLEVARPESCGTSPYSVIRIKKSYPTQGWQVLNGAITRFTNLKIVIAVDEDIDPRDADAVNWALAFRMQPERDVRIVQGMVSGLDPSAVPPTAPPDDYPLPSGTSAILIDATRKWDFPPVALPQKQFMQKARQIWEELGLPKLSPKEPWYGYSLGYWTKENEEEAELALDGVHYGTGEKLANQRIKL